jgi:hypothetical protein
MITPVIGIWWDDLYHRQDFDCLLYAFLNISSLRVLCRPEYQHRTQQLLMHFHDCHLASFAWPYQVFSISHGDFHRIIFDSSPANIKWSRLSFAFDGTICIIVKILIASCMLFWTHCNRIFDSDHQEMQYTILMSINESLSPLSEWVECHIGLSRWNADEISSQRSSIENGFQTLLTGLWMSTVDKMNNICHKRAGKWVWTVLGSTSFDRVHFIDQRFRLSAWYAIDRQILQQVAFKYEIRSTWLFCIVSIEQSKPNISPYVWGPIQCRRRRSSPQRPRPPMKWPSLSSATI